MISIQTGFVVGIRGHHVSENQSIRDFTPGDLPRLHEIREAAFRPVFQSFRDIVGEAIAPVAFAAAEQDQAELLDRICRAGSEHEVFVVVQGTELVAFCAVKADRESGVGEIDLNAVHPDWQGRGIGTRMYGHALERLKAAGMAVATVGTGGDASHAPARRAYEKAGFTVGIPSVYLYRAL